MPEDGTRILFDEAARPPSSQTLTKIPVVWLKTTRRVFPETFEGAKMRRPMCQTPDVPGAASHVEAFLDYLTPGSRINRRYVEPGAELNTGRRRECHPAPALKCGGLPMGSERKMHD